MKDHKVIGGVGAGGEEGEVEDVVEEVTVQVMSLETVEGGEPDKVPLRTLRDPGNPTEEEREFHMASHLPYRSWCHICVEAKGKEDPILGVGRRRLVRCLR